MNASEQTRITLQGVKHSAFASKETACFAATICFDGAPVCRVENEGHGGSDHHTPLKGENYDQMEKRLEPVRAFIATLDAEPFGGMTLEPDLEIVVADALNRHLAAQLLDRKLKTVSLYVFEGEADVWSVKPKLEPTKYDSYKAFIEKRQPGKKVIILDTLPRDEALRLFQAGITQ